MAGPEQRPPASHPALRNMPGGFLPPEAFQGAPPPPPPPGMAGEWAAPKPTSGKATASLVCGLGGILLGFFCPVLGAAVLVGLVLGIMAIAETGRNGTRSGRGLAIAGTAASAFSLVAVAALTVFFVARATESVEAADEVVLASVDRDLELIGRRLQIYYAANGNSLGEGGPVLARAGGAANAAAMVPQPANSVSANQPRVAGALLLSHLVSDTELEQKHSIRYELTITGRSSATLRAFRNWDRKLMREAAMEDAATGLWMETGP